ncbi:hypothetical protein [Amycolatopsis vastitatis]|uniref:PPE family domain-containing protein n=1 Tax=Amycolatopsis vastitatis TaxID=1905142 RepID=A0A229SLZ5_9PSEU|nr:hypothetical protein [Amycolatopsis vastitatis]OXM59820.1 hypothetical protein CF165_45420 [Amycolatopsis vastitatis]
MSREPDTWYAGFQRALRQVPETASAGGDLELRPSAGVPATVWENVSHEQMMTEISTDANPAAVAESAQEWLRIGDELLLHERALARAVEDSRGDWRGAGGDAVRRHLTAVGHWLATTGRGALFAGRQQQLHAQALEEARKRMAANPPVEFSAEAANARLQGITDPVEYARRLGEDTRARQAQEAAHAEAVRIMTEYDRTLAQAVATPFFAAPPDLPGVSVSSGQTMGLPGAVPSDSVVAAEVPGRVPPGSRVDSPVASGVDSVGVGGAGGVPPARPPEQVVAAGVVPGSPVVGGVSGFRSPDSEAARGVPPFPQPDSPVVGGVPRGRPPERVVAAGVAPESPVAGGVPPLPQPDSPVVGGARPGSPVAGAARSDLPVVGGVPPFPQPDSTAVSGARWVPPFPTDPVGAGGVPPLPPPDPAAVSGTAGPGPVPPGGVRGGRRRDDIVRSGGPRVPELPEAAHRDDAPGPSSPRRDDVLPPGAGTPERSGAALNSGPAPDVPRPPAGQQGTPGTPGAPAGVPRAGGKPAEDEEHRVADYLEADPELFAAEQPVVPPTLGDWKKNKNWRKKP